MENDPLAPQKASDVAGVYPWQGAYAIPPPVFREHGLVPVGAAAQRSRAAVTEPPVLRAHLPLAAGASAEAKRLFREATEAEEARETASALLFLQRHRMIWPEPAAR